MKPICLKLTSTLVLLISFVSCRGTMNSVQDKPVFEAAQIAYTKGVALFLSQKCENAIPHFKYVIESSDKNSKEALLYLAKCYDKTSQPEKYLVAAEEFLTYGDIPQEQELLVRILNIKNLIKTQNLNPVLKQKTDARKIISALRAEEYKDVLNEVTWAFSFKCDNYCIEEINFIKESQDLLLFFVDQKSSSSKASQLILETYDFYYNLLSTDYYDQTFKHHLAAKLLDSLATFKKYEIVPNNFSPSKNLLKNLEKKELEITNWK